MAFLHTVTLKEALDTIKTIPFTYPHRVHLLIHQIESSTFDRWDKGILKSVFLQRLYGQPLRIHHSILELVKNNTIQDDFTAKLLVDWILQD